MKVKDITKSARNCVKNVEKLQKLGVKDEMGYYYCKNILGAKKTVKDLKIKPPKEPTGDYLSRQLKKDNYIAGARRLVAYVEEHKQMPNYVTIGKFQVEHKLYTYLFAKALVTSVDTGYLPQEVNVSSKYFSAKVETAQQVYDYACKKFNKQFTTIDGLLAYVKAYFHYLFYFDDRKSNKEVIDSKSGNCTDLLQFLVNMAKVMGYECKVYHVKCKISGTGHVWGKFKHKKHTGGNWITRDIASVADGGSITSVWCSDGYVQATNPSWFMANLNK